MPYLGTRKIAAKLQEEGYDVGRKLVRSYILNSDQGSQFTGEDYKQLLREHRIRQSMDGKSRWADNPLRGRLPKLGLTDCGSGMQPKSEWAKSVHDVFLLRGLDKGTIILVFNLPSIYERYTDRERR